MSGLPWGDREKVDQEDAVTLVFLARDMLTRLRENQDHPKKQRNLLAIAGYPFVTNDREYQMVVSTIRRLAFPPRSRGIY